MESYVLFSLLLAGLYAGCGVLNMLPLGKVCSGRLIFLAVRTLIIFLVWWGINSLFIPLLSWDSRLIYWEMLLTLFVGAFIFGDYDDYNDYNDYDDYDYYNNYDNYRNYHNDDDVDVAFSPVSFILFVVMLIFIIVCAVKCGKIGSSEVYRDMLPITTKVDSVFEKNIKPTSLEKMRTVNRSVALGQVEQKMGEISGLGSWCEIGKMSLQRINGTFTVTDGKGQKTRLVFDNDFIWAAPLEYRGYDSAGIALAGKELTVCKCAGRVSALAAMVPSSDARAGIGHTRWATNGAPCAENAHPHLSFDGSLAVVHNGVIENCDEISRLLKREGVRMASGTDSEMIAHMLALEKGDIRERIFRVAEKLEGAMTILVLPRGEKRVYCFKRGAALLVAEGKRECFAASDAAALSPYVKEARALKDGECAVLSPKGAEFFSREGAASPSPLIPVALSPALGHDCHMREEISEIPRALISTYRSFASRFPESEEVVARLKRSSRILLAGCGTGYHACL